MPQVWKSAPRHKITVVHSGTNYDLSDYCENWLVRRRENGFDVSTLVLADGEGHNLSKNWQDKFNTDDAITVEQKDYSDPSFVTLLDGVIRKAVPQVSQMGFTVSVECDGSGSGLGEMLCAQEYGSQSLHPTLDTIKEIVEDASNGIVPLWVNKLLGTATDSGYAYTTQVEDIAGAVPYAYFPYKPAMKALNDICDIVQATKGANAGPHWIVDTSKRLLIATVGNHGAPASTFWPTWWRTDAAGSTLVEGEDFIFEEYQQLTKEANYVLFHGTFRKPADGDKWTEATTGWGTTNCTLGTANGAAYHKVGTCSLSADPDAGLTGYWYYPSVAANWDLTKAGGKYNIPSLNFYIKVNTDIELPINVTMDNGGGNYYRYDLARDLCDESGTLITNEFFHISIPVGPYARRNTYDRVWTESGAPDWTTIDYIRFGATSKAAVTGTVWIDGLNLSGYVLRAARQNAAFSSSDPAKLKLITDDLAKDDSLVTATDTGTMAELAHAELLRCKTTPLVGSIKFPMANDLLPGQLIHVHGKKKIDDSFRVDSNFRVTQIDHVRDNINGYQTLAYITSDIVNSQPRPLPNQYNLLMKAIRPEFQDRQSSSMKAREIDITQAIMENSY